MEKVWLKRVLQKINSLIVDAPDLVITKSHFFIILCMSFLYEKT